MGVCSGKDESNPKNMTDKNTLKLLILGLSGSGKTTFTKQMKILHMDGFQDFEFENFKKIIYRNISNGMHELLTKLDENNFILSESNIEASSIIKQDPMYELNQSNVEMTKNIWRDESIQQGWDNYRNTMINAHLDYFIEHIDRICEEKYVPSYDDVVRCRQYTIGASTTTFFYNKLWWKLIDVGGQTPERKKWNAIVIEHQIKCLIYFVALDEFDVESTEEPGLTKLELSLKIWEEVMKSEDFKNESVILFFNKKDSYQEIMKSKTRFKAFMKRYKDYKGKKYDEEQARNFIRDKFVKVAKDNKVTLEDSFYVDFTCAIDTHQISLAWSEIQANLFKKRSTTGGFELG